MKKTEIFMATHTHTQRLHLKMELSCKPEAPICKNTLAYKRRWGSTEHWGQMKYLLIYSLAHSLTVKTASLHINNIYK